MAILITAPGGFPIGSVPVGGVLFGASGGSTSAPRPAVGYPTVDTGPGANWFNSPDNIQADDGNYASYTYSSGGTNGFMYPQTFNFAIDSSAIIDGIQLEYQRHADRQSNGVRDQIIETLKAGTAVGTNKGDNTTLWATADEIITYGGAADLWGSSWTPADINNAGFGFYMQTFSNLPTQSGWIDYVKASIYYHFVYTNTAGGTVLTGGSANVSIGSLGQGGAVTNSTATFQFTYVPTPTSGTGASGSATVSYVANATGTSGALINGTPIIALGVKIGGVALCGGTATEVTIYTNKATGGIKCNRRTFTNGYFEKVGPITIDLLTTQPGFPVLLRIPVSGLVSTAIHFEDGSGNTLPSRYIDYNGAILFAAVKVDLLSAGNTCWLYW